MYSKYIIKNQPIDHNSKVVMSKNEVSNTSQLLSNSRLGGKDFSYQ